MKKTTLILMAAMCSLAAAAQSYRSVRIEKTDGSSVVVDGEKDLAARFDDGEMTFAVGSKVLFSIPVAEVRGWRLSEESRVAMPGDGSPFRISFEGGTLTVSGMPEGARVLLYDLSGMEIPEPELMSPGSVPENACSFDVSRLAAGTYILTCNGKSIKIHISQ